MAAKLEFEKKPKLLLTLGDSLIMIRRSTMHIIRNTDQLLGFVRFLCQTSPF